MRETILFNEGWKYHEDIPEKLNPEILDIIRYLEAKTECRKWGPASKDYQEGLAWEDVQLPHDYIVKQEPEYGWGHAEGHFRYHNAWYRKHFTLDAEDEGRRIALYFEGVATHAYVYVNGCLAGRNFCGYTAFELDITSFVLYGQDNVVAVYDDSTSSHEGWWYQGGGIYRDVWLLKGDQAHILRDGVFIHPENLGGEKWNLPIDVEIRNDDTVARSLRVECEGFDPQGKSMFVLKGALDMAPWTTEKLSLNTSVENTARWDIDTPSLYTVETRVYDGDVLIDAQTDRYGYRTILFNNKGFFLNGRRVEIKGQCGHQDYGLTGKVMPRRAAFYRTGMYKEMGVNGVRCSHYPHTRHLMDAYDEMGFVVMAETRWYSDEPEAMKQLETLMRQERNRPCVVLWSIGNEEPLHAEERGARIARRMFARARQIDNTRPLTTVVCHDPLNAAANREVDVISINYHHDVQDPLHERYPEKAMVCGETCATATVRGYYGDNHPEHGMFSAYDAGSGCSPLCREDTWKFVTDRPWMAGAFQWDAVEHRGESVWPRLCSVSGAIDLYLQKKDAFFQNQSHWSDKPMVHILPHWNHRGAEGRPIKVWLYSNCEEAELILNGKSLGRRVLKPYTHEEWFVPFEAGKLEAVAYNNGVEAARDVQETTGRAAALKLIVDSAADKADGQDIVMLTCVVLDEQGREIPDAAPTITFECNRFGQVIGTGSDMTEHLSVTNNVRKMRAGRCATCVRVGKEPGTLTVVATADGLASAFADIELK